VGVEIQTTPWHDLRMETFQHSFAPGDAPGFVAWLEELKDAGRILTFEKRWFSSTVTVKAHGSTIQFIRENMEAALEEHRRFMRAW
jgi:hypothetical protein